jgi:diguanylate cyclase (GGDEF)-like protein
MLLLDLDHFKDINDTLGHVVGDEMLQAVEARLSALAEPRDLVCRIGGDEFVVLRRRYSSMEQVRQFAEMLRAALQEPVVLHGVTLTVGCSVGIALAPEHAVTLEDLQRCADIALYAAKATRGAACFYDRLNDRHSVALLGLHADLRAALESEDDEQIWVAYQPQLDVASGRVHSLECLARWNHPQAGPVSPDVFVPIAENTALINLLLYRVLDRALAQLARWDAEGQHFHASLNLSARQVSDLALPDIIGQHLERHRIAPERIVLEVTESRLMDDPERSSQVLRGIRDLGVGLSIDDFGTGYSSLSYLQRLAVDELKIDKSFTAELSRSGDATIVRSTIDLGHNLGLRVVAEGVEDPDTAAKLRRLGCDVLQGFLVGRPMAPEELSAHLAALRPDLSDQGRPSSEWSAIDPNGPSRVQPLAQALLRGA